MFMNYLLFFLERNLVKYNISYENIIIFWIYEMFGFFFYLNEGGIFIKIKKI